VFNVPGPGVAPVAGGTVVAPGPVPGVHGACGAATPDVPTAPGVAAPGLVDVVDDVVEFGMVAGVVVPGTVVFGVLLAVVVPGTVDVVDVPVPRRVCGGVVPVPVPAGTHGTVVALGVVVVLGVVG